MFRYDRFNELVKETGVKKSHICRRIEKSPYYLRDAEKNGIDIKGDSLDIIAAILGTSSAYLSGTSDEKKPTPDVEGGLGPLDRRLNELLAQATDDTKQAMIVLLEQSQRR